MNAAASEGAAPLAIHVDLSREGLWEIRERGCDRMLATFGDEDDACAYADGIARVVQGACIVVNGQARTGSRHVRIAPG
ncbi:hypothetical protein DSM104443_02132 [Usitatibacter rugosus]|uniref:Uncharacterized protein n=1 Tax=Usitatibacter rugosus TaxID=2732067 RepID=A0A6M4GUR1_9PROT|nr:hypothetical protein [Usitatibacter rugosus]QJR11061.1 hypothetical protein DSM104443_02132 [Usitatibacter rugosus]